MVRCGFQRRFCLDYGRGITVAIIDIVGVGSTEKISQPSHQRSRITYHKKEIIYENTGRDSRRRRGGGGSLDERGRFSYMKQGLLGVAFGKWVDRLMSGRCCLILALVDVTDRLCCSLLLG